MNDKSKTKTNIQEKNIQARTSYSQEKGLAKEVQQMEEDIQEETTGSWSTTSSSKDWSKTDPKAIHKHPTYLKLVQQLKDGTIKPIQAAQAYSSIEHSLRTTAEREKILQEVNEAKRKEYMGVHSGMGQKDTGRSRESNANSNASRFPFVKSSLSVVKGSKIAKLSNDVGISHTYVGDPADLAKGPTETMIADKNSCRFVGGEFITGISTATPAPVQGSYIFPFLLNPRSWVNTRAQLASLEWLYFKINHVKFKYLPVCPTTTPGGLMQYFNKDVDNNNTLYGGNLNVRVASDYDNMASSNVWNASEVGIENFQEGYLFCDLTGENRFTYAGQYLMMAMGTLPTSTSLGNLFIEYDITFHGKVLNPFNSNLVASGSATYTKTFNVAYPNFAMDPGSLVGGTAPPNNAKCQIVVYDAVNMANIQMSDQDSGTATFTVGLGSNMFCYMGVTGSLLYFYRKPPSSFNTDQLVCSVISGGSQTVTFSFTWWVFQDVI